MEQAMSFLDKLDALETLTLNYLEQSSTSQSDLAWALLGLGRHGELVPQFAKDPQAVEIMGALAWWLFVRAPALSMDQFLLTGMNLDLVITADRSIKEVFDDLRALERSASGRNYEAPDWLAPFIDQAWDESVLHLEGQAWIDRVPKAMALLGDHEEDLRAILAGHMKHLLEQFDTSALAKTSDGTDADQQAERPSSAEGWMYKGHHHYEAGDLESAQECYDQALAEDASLDEALQRRGITRAALEDLDGALADFNAHLVTHPDDIVTLTNRALVLHSLERSDEAVRDFSRALELHGEDPELLVNRGIARFASGDLPGARQDFDRAIKLNPRQAVAYLQRGNLFRMRAELGYALSDYAQAIKLAPKNPDGYSARGFAFLELGDVPKAIADFSEAIKLQPADALNYFNRAHALVLQEDWSGAVADYTRAIALDPEDPQAYVNRGSAQMLSGNLEEALEDWEMAISLDPAYPTPYVKRASMWIAAGELERAALDLSTALECAPKDWPHGDQVESMLEEIRAELGFDTPD
jgi:tetratricopeptide (TPR) repeat protein